MENQIYDMTQAKQYPKPEEKSKKVSEPVISLYESVSTQKNLTSAITGEELLNRLRPRIKALFDK
ncbi:hypothetical protein CE91St1_51350 [Parabacteroides goldsteinii]|uniref:hypothetical protein n=1 Tax=Parabacteroides TaxID=375288 RepID=UPI0011C2199E|nr:MULTISPECIES: hypothetical protein [Parabacteroides]GKG75992.1 hypothetical protein CE91St1_51350 [Parabacteroides goldsteinii]GKG80600.1 hypothetical protein CE91St2_37920 [Parabacteroides goldsteinii]